MNIKRRKIGILTIVSLAVMGLSTLAFAQRGYGPGDCPGYGGGYGRGDVGNLSEEERNQLAAERERFLEQTKDLRDQIGAKRDALADELSKDNPDSEAAAKLQNEISELKTQFDQKRLEHLLELKKINPELGSGYGHMKGGGGRGGYGRGPCWR